MSLYKDIKVTIPVDKVNLKKIGKYTYIEYFVMGKWNKEKRYSLNKKINIGRLVDSEYMNPNDNFYSVYNYPNPKRSNANTFRVIKDAGDYFLVKKIIETNKLLETLENCFEKDSVFEILSMVHYMVWNNTSQVLNLDNFFEKNLTFTYSYFDDKQVDEIFQKITKQNVYSFLSNWNEMSNEKKSIFYDLSSLNKRDNNLNLFGNSNGEAFGDFKAKGVSLIIGQKNKLPLYYETSSVTINDKNQLKTMLENASKFDLKPEMFVMSREYYSTSNIEYIHSELKAKYILPVSNSHFFVKKIIDDNRYIQSDLTNRIDGTHIYGIRVKYKKLGDVLLFWDSNKKEYEIDKDNDKVRKLEYKISIKEKLNPEDMNFIKNKWVITSRIKNTINGIKINHEEYKDQIRTYGYFAFLTNDSKLSLSEALNIYNQKFNVSFFENPNTGLDLPMETDKKNFVIGRDFVDFLALITKTSFDLVINRYKKQFEVLNGLEKAKNINPSSLSVKGILDTMSTIRVCNWTDHHPEIISPYTQKQKQLFKIFKITDDSVSDDLKTFDFMNYQSSIGG